MSAFISDSSDRENSGRTQQESVTSVSKAKSNISKYIYDLKSVIVHIGTPTVGHYIAIVRPSPVTKPNYWVLLDDDRVSVISQEKMEEIAFGGSSFTMPGLPRGVSSTAYMLLYEQKEV